MQGTMTPERVAMLNELGFDWDPRSAVKEKKPRAKSNKNFEGLINESSSDSSVTSIG
jgi:hypothetical protein